MKKEITRTYENYTLTITTSNRQKAWMAEIVGKDERYGFGRKFLDVYEDGGRWVDYRLEDGKLYCWKEKDEQQAYEDKHKQNNCTYCGSGNKGFIIDWSGIPRLFHCGIWQDDVCQICNRHISQR